MRMKFRRDRRPGLPLEPVWRFYPQYIGGMARKFAEFSALFLKLHKMYRQIRREGRQSVYMDLALSPPSAEDLETHELFQSDAAQNYVARQRGRERVASA